MKTREELFSEWLSAHAVPGRLSDYYIALADVEELSHKKNLFKGPIFEVTDPVVTAGIVRAVNSDRIFRFIHRQNYRSITEVAQLFHRYTKEVNNSDKIETNSTASLRDEPSTARQVYSDNRIEEEDKHSEDAAQTRSIEDTIELDFSQDTSFIKREPISISYFGERFPATSWRDLYVIACEKLADDYPGDFDAMLKDLENHIIHSVSSAQYMSKPAIINNLYCVETMKSTANLIADLKTLLDNCRVDYENLIICFKNDLADEEDVKIDALTTAKNEDWILSQLHAKDITYRDNRRADGCLWIVGGHELESFINECKWKGYILHFKPDGCNAFPGKQVWWTKSKSTTKGQASQQMTLKDGDQDQTPAIENKTSADDEAFFQWMAENYPDSDFITIRAYYKSLNKLLVGRGILSKPIATIKDEKAIARAEAWADKVIKGDEFRKTAVRLLQEYKQYLRVEVPKSVPVSNTGTITEAITVVLQQAKKPLTISQIYNEIVKQNLYSFNAQDPVNVVRETIAYACEGINRHKKAKHMLFGVHIINHEENKYYLLDEAPADSTIKEDTSFIENVEENILKYDLNGATFEELAQDTNFSVASVRRAVQNSENIMELSGRIIHRDALVDFEMGAEQFSAILDKLMIKNDGYVSAQQLYDYVHADMQMFLNDNDIDDKQKVYDFAQYLFEKVEYNNKRYSFQNKTHISHAESSVGTIYDVMLNFARERGGFFQEDDLVSYMKQVKLKTGNLRGMMQVYTKPTFLFYEHDPKTTYITAESIGIDNEWLLQVRNSMDLLFEDMGDHVVIRDVQPWWYAMLPSLPGGRSWTALLLQSILRHYSAQLGARTISRLDSMAGDTLDAMIVQIDSEVQTFADAVAAVILDGNIEQRSFETEQLRQLLVDRGLIARNELISNMPKALANDDRYAWDADGQHVIVKL